MSAASWTAFQHVPAPVLFVCEDNGLGISVQTPAGWVHAAYGSRPHLKYFAANGCDVVDAYEVATEAVAWVRANRRPAFLHLRVVRLMGHAGTDPEATYRTAAEISADIAEDPCVKTAELLCERGVLTPVEAVERYEGKRALVRDKALTAAARPQLTSAAEVMKPLAPRRPELVLAEVARAPEPSARAKLHDQKLPEDEGPITLATA